MEGNGSKPIHKAPTPCPHTLRFSRENTLMGQVQAMEYMDSHLEKRLFTGLPESCFILTFSDHGTLFGDGGLRHHGFYHPKAMEIPMAFFIKKQGN